MKKYLFLIPLLLVFTKVFAQDEITSTFNVTPKKVKKEVKAFFKTHYISQVIDNRLKKKELGNMFNIWKRNYVDVNFVQESLETAFKDYFNEIQKEEGNKKKIVVKVNHFRVGNYMGAAHVVYTYLDLDFFDTDNKLIAHYHGRKYDNGEKETLKRIIDEILQSALVSAMKQSKQEITPLKSYHLDTSYVPQIGFYKNYFDYKYNKPMITKEKYKMKIEANVLHFDTFSDTLSKRIFGYSDGKNFYAFPFDIRYEHNSSKLQTHGRYLYLRNTVNNLTPEEIKIANKQVILNSLSPYTAGDRVELSYKLCDMILDLETGENVTENNEQWLAFCQEELKVDSADKEAIISALNRLNQQYHKEN